MGFNHQKCPRSLDDRCCPLSNVVSTEGETFICVGYNRKEHRNFKQDRFTHCVRGEDGTIDTIQHMDRRDLLDTVSVASQALSADENWRVHKGDLTDDQMNEMDLIALERSVTE